MSISQLRKMMLSGLAGLPTVLERLTIGLDDARLDLRPDPERFTIREVVAHLADYDVIFLNRMKLCLSSESPNLKPYDPEQLAIDNDYAHKSPAGSIAQLTVSRAQLIAFFTDLTEDQLARVGRHGTFGNVTIADQLDMVHAHDAVHLRQVAEWLGK